MCLSPTVVYIPSHLGITAIFSAAALQSKKRQRPKENITVCFFFSCRCCYSCKQKSRHPIIPVEEGERQDPRQRTSPLPSPPKKKKQNLARISSIKSMDCCESTPLQPTGTYSLTHSPMFGIPETLPYSETLSLSASLFLSFCPALPPPIRNSASQDPLRACVSCLSVLSVCLVSFSPPGRTTTFFTLSLDTDTNLSRNRPHRRSIPLRAFLTKTKGKKETKKRVHLDSRI